ncbi:MAG: FAD binding domain-containing protein [Chitinophagaceae bacterium]|nr:FAD binding domain-containing protein [Chitinophagaceae bacterium]
MVHFILNDQEINTSLPKGTLLLDFIRYQQRLTGTKIGCREGDCGACSVLVGEIKHGELVYRSATSCLMAIGNARGKHIVTVEGTNVEGLNFIQQCFAEEGATQCGFCTPGFMVSLAGFTLSGKEATPQTAVDAVNGNICRCTGYKSIERATAKIADKLSERKLEDVIAFAVANNFLPAYFINIKERLLQLDPPVINTPKQNGSLLKFLGGGTDLYVQQHDTMHEEEIDFMFDKSELNGIKQAGNKCYLGAAVTVTDILESPVFQDHFPNLAKHIRLVSSTPIRNMATIAGNLVNASPIGDFTIFFLALNAQLVLSDGTNSREVPLQQFYKGYKKLAKTHEEYIEQIWFELPAANTMFNFEKVCKRTHLDIASVNSAVSLQIENDKIVTAYLSAGGVGPVPAYLSKASAFLHGREINERTIEETIAIAKTEISPISDARGTATYKSFLLGQLIKAHFVTIFPAIKIQLLASE